MRSIAIDDVAKFVSFLMAVCIFFFEMMYPFFIWRVASRVVGLNKSIENYKEKVQIGYEFKEKLEKK